MDEGSSENQHIAFADGFLYVPDARRVRGEHQRVAGLDMKGLTAIGSEGAAPLDEMAELLLHDLAPPAAGRALPDAGLDSVITLHVRRGNL